MPSRLEGSFDELTAIGIFWYELLQRPRLFELVSCAISMGLFPRCHPNECLDIDVLEMEIPKVSKDG